MKNTEIEEFLDKYLVESSTGCLLIDGEWGIGKTHFINKYLEKIEEKRNKGIELDCDVIKISLYGIESVKELSNRVNTNLLTKIGKIVNTGRNLFGSWVKANFFIDISSIDFETLLSNLTIKRQQNKKIILIFDDLERCSIKIKDVLGYTNNINENYNQKAIVIANTKEIKKKQSKDFDLYKEKVFSFILNFESDFEMIASEILKENFPDNLSDNHIKIIIDVFRKYNYKNLRTILKLSHKIKMLFSDINTDKIDNKILADALNTMSIFSIQNLEKNSKNPFTRKANMEFFNDYINNGDYSLIEIKNQLSEINDIYVNDKENPLNEIDNLFLAEDDDFLNTLSKFESWIKEGKIFIPKYPRIIEALLSLKDKLDIFEKNDFVKNIVNLMCESISLESKSKEVSNVELYKFTLFDGRSNEYLDDLKSLIKEKQKKDIYLLFNHFDFSNDVYYELCEQIPDDQDLIEVIGVENVYNKVINSRDSNEIDNIRAILLTYYKKHTENRESLSLIELKNKIKSYIDKNQTNFGKSRLFIYNILLNTLEGKYY